MKRIVEFLDGIDEEYAFYELDVFKSFELTEKVEFEGGGGFERGVDLEERGFEALGEEVTVAGGEVRGDAVSFQFVVCEGEYSLRLL
jgi:hypothetical protein